VVRQLGSPGCLGIESPPTAAFARRTRPAICLSSGFWRVCSATSGFDFRQQRWDKNHSPPADFRRRDPLLFDQLVERGPAEPCGAAGLYDCATDAFSEGNCLGHFLIRMHSPVARPVGTKERMATSSRPTKKPNLLPDFYFWVRLAHGFR